MTTPGGAVAGGGEADVWGAGLTGSGYRVRGSGCGTDGEGRAGLMVVGA